MKCRIQRSLVQLSHIQTDPDVLPVAAYHSLNMNNEPAWVESTDNLASKCSDDQKCSSGAANVLKADINASLLKLDLSQLNECLTHFLE